MDNFSMSPATEALQYRNVRYNLVYKNQPDMMLPRGSKLGYGCVIALMSPSKAASMKTINDSYASFYKCGYKHFTMDTRISEKIGARNVKINNTSKARKEFMNERENRTMKFVTPAELSATVIKTLKSYIYDTGTLHELFFKYRYIRTPEDICRSYIAFIKDKLDKLAIDGYDSRVVYISLKEWKNAGAKFGVSKKNLNNPLSIIMLCLYKYSYMLHPFISNNYDIMIVDEELNEFIKIKFDESHMVQTNAKAYYNKVKLLLTKMSAFEDQHDEIVVDEEVNDIEATEKKRLVSNLTRNLTGNVANSNKTNPQSKPAISVSNSTKSNTLKDITRVSTSADGKPGLVPGLNPGPVTKSTPTKPAVPKKPPKVEDINIFNMEKYLSGINTGNPEEDQAIADDIEGIVSTMVATDDTLSDNSIPPEEVEEKVEEKVKKELFISKFVPERTAAQQRKLDEYAKTHEEVLKQPISVMASKVISHSDFHNAINTSNEYVKESSFVNFDKSYLEKKFRGDINMCVDSLSHATYPVFVESMSIEDTSNALNQKETYEYHLVDERGRKHTIKLDIPKIIDNNYVFLNGNKKFIGKQRILRPVIKISPDEVQICGWINKCRIVRYGQAITSDIMTLKKFLTKHEKKFDVHYGNAKIKNKGYRTSLDFDVLAKSYTRFTIKGDNAVREFYFDLPMLEDRLKELKVKDIDGKAITSVTSPGTSKLIVGIQKVDNKDWAPIYTEIDGAIDTKQSGSDSPEWGIISTILSYLSSADRKEISSMTTGKRFAYARINVMSKYIPVALFAFYCVGFTEAMKQCGINYKVFDSMKDVKEFFKDESDKYYDILKCADKVILWNKNPYENALFMNGTKGLPFENYTFEELDSKDTYIDMLPLFYASPNMSYNLDQFKDFLLDDCTKEILADFNQPTELIPLLFYAIKMLVNNQYTSDIDVSQMRIRGNEIIPQIAYQVVANAYREYRKTAYKDKPTKITVNQNEVIKALMKATLIEDASVSNPVKTLVKTHNCTVKAYTEAQGINLTGMNQTDGMTMAKRAYHPSMMGVMAITTAHDANCGIVRDMTVEPKITSTRGYIETTDPKDYDSLNPLNLFSFAELLTPPGVRHDDPQRTAMMRGQTTQMVMTDDTTPVLIGNKVEAIVPYHMSGEFCFVAKHDGEIIDVKDGIYVVKYDDGTFDSFETNPVIHKNSDDGAYTEVEFVCTHGKGYKFQKNEVLANEKRAFTKSKDDLTASMNIGVLAKVAVLSTYDIYEDSEPVTKKLSERLGYWAIDMNPVTLNAGTTLKTIVKVGDHINIGDPLVTFDNASGDFDLEELLNAYTKGASDKYNLREELIKSNETTIKADCSGEIADIRIYTTVEVDQLSPSLQKLVKDYHSRIDKQAKFLDKYKNKGDNDYYKCGRLLTETTNVTEAQYGKVKGSYVGEGILIEFYIKHKDILKKGDKISNYTALKGVNSHVIDEGLEPYSEYRPEEEVSAFIAPLGILARKTPSVFKPLFGNKVLIETKRKLIEDFFRD